MHVVSTGNKVANRLFGQHARIHNLNMNRAFSPFQDLKSILYWLRLLVKVRPQVLVVGTPKASLLGTLAAKIMRIPNTIYVIHGLRSENAQGFFGKVLMAAEEITLNLAERKIAVSDSLATAVEHAHPKFKNQIEVLGFGSLNGVDLRRFKLANKDDRMNTRNRFGIDRNTFVLGFIGRLHQDKGGYFLIKMMNHERARNLNIHLLVVGELEDEKLRVDMETLKSQGHLTITGWTDEPETALPAIDLLVHPTHREGLGMSLLESQAAGVPVLTNRVTGTIDAVKDGVGGKFAETESLSSWFSILETLISDQIQLQEMGKRGRVYVESRYDRRKVVKGFVDYIEGFASRKE